MPKRIGASLPDRGRLGNADQPADGRGLIAPDPSTRSRSSGLVGPSDGVLCGADAPKLGERTRRVRRVLLAARFAQGSGLNNRQRGLRPLGAQGFDVATQLRNLVDEERQQLERRSIFPLRGCWTIPASLA
jgi:hypothetical protein